MLQALHHYYDTVISDSVLPQLYHTEVTTVVATVSVCTAGVHYVCMILAVLVMLLMCAVSYT